MVVKHLAILPLSQLSRVFGGIEHQLCLLRHWPEAGIRRVIPCSSCHTKPNQRIVKIAEYGHLWAKF